MSLYLPVPYRCETKALTGVIFFRPCPFSLGLLASLPLFFFQITPQSGTWPHGLWQVAETHKSNFKKFFIYFNLAKMERRHFLVLTLIL